MGIAQQIEKTLAGAAQAAKSITPEASDIMVPAVRRSSEFMRGRNNVTMGGWRPALRETKEDIAGVWEQSVARATDIQQNSGWVSGMIDQAVANTVGDGLRLNYLPDADALGMSAEQAQAFARDVERRFNIWAGSAEECDIEGRRTFGQLQAAAFRSWFPTGETFAEIPWRKRRGEMHGTKIRLLPPTRLSRASNSLKNIEQGVRMNRDGFPTGYVVVNNDPILGMVERNVRARDRYGRKRVVHVFDGLPGQVRGITPLVPALYVAKQFDQLSDATLMAAIIQTVFAMTIESTAPTEETLDALLSPAEQGKLKGGASAYDAWYEAQLGYYDGMVLDTGMNGRIAHLFPGQKLETTKPEISAQNYKDHALHLLREMSRCAGLTYESATGDYEGATYSSVRSATGEIFLVTCYRRKNVVAPFCQAGFEAWLEEDIEAGRTKVPDGLNSFFTRKAAMCRAIWLGTPKPQADDLKTARAHQIWAALGVMTDEMIARELGADIEDVYAQRQREMQLRQSFGLPEPVIPGAPSESGSDEDEDEREIA